MLRGLSGCHLAALALLWGAENLIGERHWLATLLAYAPQFPGAIPSLLLLPLALIQRDRVQIALQAAALWLCLILMGFQLPRLVPNANSGPTVRVLTWNIHHGMDGFDRLIEQIQRADADVLCLQEVYGWNNKALRDRLPGYKFVFAGDTAIASRHRIVRHGVRPFHIEQAGSRLLLTAQIEVEGRTLTVACTHLATAAHGSNLRRGQTARHLENSAATRTKQVDIILDEFADEALGPIVLCGDFNTPPRGLLYRRLTGRFTDVFAAVGTGLGHTYPAHRGLLRIDYVFCAGGLEPLRIDTLATRRSDHRPVLAELALPE